MPRTKKVQVNESSEVVQPVEQTEAQQLPPNKDDYMKARATIKSYREAQKSKPKRVCSEKQLAALAAGRARNKRFANKTTGTSQ